MIETIIQKWRQFRQWIKTKVNLPYQIFCVVVVVVIAFFSTTKLWLPDDRVDESNYMLSTKIVFSKMQVDTERGIAEISITEPIKSLEDDIDYSQYLFAVRDYDLNTYETSIFIESEITEQRIYTLQIYGVPQDLSKVYYFEILFKLPEKNRRVIYDYRTFTEAKLQVKDAVYQQKQSLSVELSRLQNTLLDIDKQLENKTLGAEQINAILASKKQLETDIERIQIELKELGTDANNLSSTENN